MTATTTDRNPRIIKEQINELVHSLNSHIQQLKYSYLSDEDLFTSPILPEISKEAEKIYKSYKGAYFTTDGSPRKPTIQESSVIWASKLLMRFQDRLKEPFRPTIEVSICKWLELGILSQFLTLSYLYPKCIMEPKISP